MIVAMESGRSAFDPLRTTTGRRGFSSGPAVNWLFNDPCYLSSR
jgi:hypothetical protein